MKLQWNKAEQSAPPTVKPQDPSADDIKDLFRKFDADPEQYREIGREGRAASAEARWPMLSRLSIGEAALAPSVCPAQPALPSWAAAIVEPRAAPTARVPPAAPVVPRAAPAPQPQPQSLAAIFQRLAKAPGAAAPDARPLFKRFKTP